MAEHFISSYKCTALYFRVQTGFDVRILQRGKKEVMLLLSSASLFYFFCFYTRHDVMWEILAHRFIIISKPAVPTKRPGKRICANLVFMSPCLKHLQGCDTNRLNRAETKLGTHCFTLYRCTALLSSGRVCVCVCNEIGQDDQR